MWKGLTYSETERCQANPAIAVYNIQVSVYLTQPAVILH